MCEMNTRAKGARVLAVYSVCAPMIIGVAGALRHAARRPFTVHLSNTVNSTHGARGGRLASATLPLLSPCALFAHTNECVSAMPLHRDGTLREAFSAINCAAARRWRSA